MPMTSPRAEPIKAPWALSRIQASMRTPRGFLYRVPLSVTVTSTRISSVALLHFGTLSLFLLCAHFHLFLKGSRFSALKPAHSTNNNTSHGLERPFCVDRTVDGTDLTHYNVEILDKGNKATCWIASSSSRAK